ncbi:MAG: bacteriophage Gp15 family protein [Oscillospiraceae bacterium]|nr:bacteriophage Gp15 family protein [Oscillospiraceae bacterium]
MFNIMLDRLPDSFEGYLIRTDFRIGIQISQALADVNLHDDEKIRVAAGLLFGEGLPPFEKAVAGMQWFLAAGAAVGNTDAAEAECFNFEQDSAEIYTAFRARYGIDLSRERLHWFEFAAMLRDLGDCALTDIVKIRLADISKMTNAERDGYIKLKQKYAIRREMSDDERDALEEFEEQLGKC